MYGHQPRIIVVSAILMLLLLETAGARPVSSAVVTVFEQRGDANYHIVLRRSLDHGQTWLPMLTLRRKAGGKLHMGSACVDRATGTVLRMCAGGWMKSDDHGATWGEWKPKIVPPDDGLGGSIHGSAPGITLRYGSAKGQH